MKTGHKIAIYSFILLLLVYSLATTYYMLNHLKEQYHANKDLQQELSLIAAKSDSIAAQQVAQAQELYSVKNNLSQLDLKINNIAPATDKIAYYQVYTIINTANQSLLLQDSSTTILLLKYAVQFLDNVHQPIFMQLKNSILQDITALQSNKDYDTSFVLVKINNLSRSIENIFSNRLTELHNVNNLTTNTVWHRFIMNTKNTLSRFWHQTLRNSSSDETLYKRMQLDIMSLKQAVITHDTALWQNSIQDISKVSQEHELTESESNLLLNQVNSMLPINIGQQKSLIHTMAALNNIANHILNENFNRNSSGNNDV